MIANKNLRSRCVLSSDLTGRLSAAVFAFILVLTCALGNGAQAQDVSSHILVIDSDRLYLQSQLGRKIEAKLSVMRVALAAKQRAAEQELKAEELALTEKRKTMSLEDFRPLAKAFDAKVQKIRVVRTAKVQELEKQQQQERDSFLKAAGPIMRQMLEEKGAVVILERRTTFYSANSVDITDEAIALLDEKLAEIPKNDGDE